MKKFLPYLKYLKPVRIQLILAILLGVLYGVSTGVGIPVIVKFLYPKIFSEENIKVSTMILYVLLPFVISIIRSSSNFFNAYYMIYCGQHLLEKIRLLVFEKIQNMHLSFFNKYTPAEIITRSSSDTANLQNALIEFAQDAIKQPITLMGSVGVMVHLCIKHTDAIFLVIFLLAIPLCILPIRIVGLKLRKKATSMQAQVGEITHRLNQNLGAIKEVRSFCLEEYEKKRYEEACDNFMYRFMKLAKYGIILSPIIEVIAALGVSVAFFYAYKKTIEPEVFIALAIALYLSYEPLKKIGRLNNEIQRGIASLERIEELLNEPITIADPDKPVPVDKFEGNIEFHDVHFSYETAPVLEGVSQKLEAGRTYALVGSSGAGKTTFTSLILRFYEAQKGRVTIDGINIKDVTLKDLRKNIALVSQDPMLFNDTVYNNILIGNLKATREEVVDAAEKAYAHDFIKSLATGYDTGVGENGTQLSGGQKQRIAIARAFLKDAPILILDEATSALDAISENCIQMALETLFNGKTVIIIAHRFSSIKHADMIFVFEGGKIVETGTHGELFGSSGVYHKLYQQQLQA